MTITNMVDKFMEWPREMLEHVEFKCSFHYLELKKKKLLEVFAKNANQLWGKGASINIEVTPSDTFIYVANSFCVIFNSRRRLSIFADIFANSIIDFASASAIPSVSHVVSCAFDILSYMLMFHSSVLL